MKFFKDTLKDIKAFAFDVDGVMARSEVLLNEQGELMRTMNTKDGFALMMARRNNYQIAIISGGKSQAVKERFVNIGINDVYMNSTTKVRDLNHFLNKHQLKAEDVLFMGDDLPDYSIMKTVGYPTCPADAVPEIKELSIYISPIRGGEGCVRDVVEQVLRAKGQWSGFDEM